VLRTARKDREMTQESVSSQDLSITRETYAALAERMQKLAEELPADQHALLSAILNLAGQRLADTLNQDVSGFAGNVPNLASLKAVGAGYFGAFSQFGPHYPDLAANTPTAVRVATLEEIGLVAPGTTASLLA
jgi:hypothetical protein